MVAHPETKASLLECNGICGLGEKGHFLRFKNKSTYLCNILVEKFSFNARRFERSIVAGRWDTESPSTTSSHDTMISLGLLYQFDPI